MGFQAVDVKDAMCVHNADVRVSSCDVFFDISPRLMLLGSALFVCLLPGGATSSPITA